MAGYLMSCIGSGLVLPFTAIYIDTYLGLGPRYVVAFFGVQTAASLIAGLIGGRLVDHYGQRVPGTIGASSIGLGYLGLAVAHTGWHIVASAVVVGLGTGLFYPAFTTAAASLAPDALRRRAFAVRHLVMNAGLGVGAGLAALAAGGTGRFRELFGLDAASYLPLMAVLWHAGTSSGSRALAAVGGAGRTGYGAVLRARPVLLLSVTHLLIALVGFAQFGASVPLLMHGPMGESARIVAAVVVVNTAAVTTLQYPLARLYERFAETLTLGLTGLIWMLAYGAGALAALATGSARIALLCTFAVMFAVGEAAYSSSFFALLTRLAPSQTVGRATAVATQAWSLGNIVGPAIGVTVVGHFSPAGSWLILSAAASLPIVATLAVVLSVRAAARAPALPESALAGKEPAP
jgi:MFS family permease